MWATGDILNARTKTALLLGVLATLALLLWHRYVPSSGPAISVGTVTTAAPPRGAEKVPRVEVPGPPRIVYLDKPRLAAALKMPSLLTIPDNVLSVATVPPHAGPTTAIAVLSPEGEGKILLRQEPPKFFELKKEWGARAGFGTGNLVLGELYLRPLRINPRDARSAIDVELRGFIRRDDAHGSDLGAAVLVDYRF